MLTFSLTSTNSAEELTHDLLVTAFANVANTEPNNVFVSVVPAVGGFGAAAQGQPRNRISASIAVESAKAKAALDALQANLKDTSSAEQFLSSAAGLNVAVVAIGDQPASTDGYDLSAGISGLGLSVLNDRRNKPASGGGGTARPTS